MTNAHTHLAPREHDHVFLGSRHAHNERKTWTVIWLCGVMMIAEIFGGNLFGSVALVADGLHMSTHAGALLIAALAYTFSRRHATDARFVFGTGKLGDLAGFTSAIVLAMIAILIGYEAISRLISPVPINFNEAIPIAVVGLLVNLVSAWLLAGDHHGHDHGHGHDHDEIPGGETQLLDTAFGVVVVDVFEDNVPPRFRVSFEGTVRPSKIMMETMRPDGAAQIFSFVDRGDYMESVDVIPEPHEFHACLRLDAASYELTFEEHGHHEHGGSATAATGDAAHPTAHRDNNMRAAYVHVIADAAVSVLVIVGLVLGRQFGWVWMDPAAGLVGALVIANWAYGLLRDTGGILLDMSPDQLMTEKVRKLVEIDGDRVTDLHVWRLGPGHIGAIVSVFTNGARDAAFYHARLGHFRWLSHVTVEVDRPKATV
ncbi:CDF family Co(II)/Ni(II) efflux transporter DmeF [Herbaspirillum sp. RV1423]|uniref:CDF family Co(II)/Ni(II) efflux transporter DmeF n=1 Tax=Herbaspirillum sp. RV1423 TaxID=1443993 RepID=UPI000550A83C|nr:CDF family Co(II)/Ni(II) efflux transporter DmeF [Herbaspirillum sp. RV1423]